LNLDFNIGARFSGTFTGQTPQAPQAQNIRGQLAFDDAEAQHFTLDFDCEGRDPCVGRYWLALSAVVRNCGYQTDSITITGLSLGAPGPISGTALLKNVYSSGTTCENRTFFDGTATVSGTWNGSSGTLSLEFSLGRFNGTFTGQSVQTRVAASIGSTSTVVQADLLFRPQDIGNTGSVYVLAVAPATVVRGALLKGVGDAMPPLGYAKTKDGKDTSVACVLAQLNQSGQLQAVSASSLGAYVSGALKSQGQAVQVVNNVATVQIGGATFYIGYGASAQAMLASGTNRAVVTIPGSLECRPQAPQTGWWWNTAEGGRGYSIEVAGSHIFFASYLYDVSGRATWLVASGNTSLDGSLFTGNLESYANGQTLSGAYRAPGAPGNAGPITLAFTDPRRGTMIWPGGTVAIERFNIVPNGLNLAPQANQPETGWWWNPSESGRGYFLEWQGGELFMAGYMYDDSGNPVWYLGANKTPNAQAFSGAWVQYGNGQTLTGTYRPAQPVNPNVAPVTITFSGPETAIMTLPAGRTTSLRRFRF
jgi:hypothetical protein